MSAQSWFRATLGLCRVHDAYTDPCINSRWQGWQAAYAERIKTDEGALCSDGECPHRFIAHSHPPAQAVQSVDVEKVSEVIAELERLNSAEFPEFGELADKLTAALQEKVMGKTLYDTPFFPFTLRCDREKGWSASDFRTLWLTIKPKSVIWYGYDVTILSTNTVEFTAFDMKSNVHGGVGMATGTYRAAAPLSLTRRHLVDRASHLAERRLMRERDLHDQEIVAGYADELLTVIGETP